MPPNSQAALRYSIIDKCLTNPIKKFPSMRDLLYAIEKELGNKVSEVTVQKDISEMKYNETLAYFAPISYHRGRHGYYYTDDEYTIKKFGPNEKEIETIELAIGILKHFKGLKMNHSFDEAIEKLLSSVNLKKTDKDINLKNAILPEEVSEMRGMEHFEKILDAIKNKTALSFIHYSYLKKTFNAVFIHPYLLKESNKRWYLVGYSEHHEEIRYFGLDRIYDPVPVVRDFISNPNEHLNDEFKNKIGLKTIKGITEHNPQVIKIKVSREMSNYLKSLPLHASQKYSETDGFGEIILELQLVPTAELISLILS